MFLECGDPPYEALQFREIGRGIIAAMQLEIRSDRVGRDVMTLVT